MRSLKRFQIHYVQSKCACGRDRSGTVIPSSAVSTNSVCIEVTYCKCPSTPGPLNQLTRVLTSSCRGKQSKISLIEHVYPEYPGYIMNAFVGVVTIIPSGHRYCNTITFIVESCAMCTYVKSRLLARVLIGDSLEMYNKFWF